MKLYLISQNKNTGHDVYDSAIVCAESEEEAKTTNPIGLYTWENSNWVRNWSNGSKDIQDDYTWTTPDNVTVKMIGEAGKNIERGVVLASFNAG